MYIVFESLLVKHDKMSQYDTCSYLLYYFLAHYSKYVVLVATVPLNLNFTYARVQKATARNIHGNCPE